MTAQPDFIGELGACIAYLRREIRMMREMSKTDIYRIYFSEHSVEAGRNVYVYITGVQPSPRAMRRWAIYIKR